MPRSITARALLKILDDLGCTMVYGKGSHVKVKCGKCRTVVPGSKGETIPTGTLAAIKRQLAPCLGETWLEDATQ